MIEGLKVSFVVEIEGCEVTGKPRCPHLDLSSWPRRCRLVQGGRLAAETVNDNRNKLIKTCPMVRAQFEALI